MKIHRDVALVEVNDPSIIDALRSAEGWDDWVLHRVSATAVAVRVSDVDAVAAALRKLGYLPRTVER